MSIITKLSLYSVCRHSNPNSNNMDMKLAFPFVCMPSWIENCACIIHDFPGNPATGGCMCIALLGRSVHQSQMNPKSLGEAQCLGVILDYQR